MPRWVIKEIAVKGMRCLADVRLQLGGVSVLIGDNGSGKSSLIEACELLRLASHPQFVTNLNNIHGGLAALSGGGTLVLEATLADNLEAPTARSPVYRYRLEMGGTSTRAEIVAERLAIDYVDGTTKHVIDRSGRRGTVISHGRNEPLQMEADPDGTLLAAYGRVPSEPVLSEVNQILASIDVHVPFDVRPRWVSRELGRDRSLRDPVTIAPAALLERHGRNLVNVFHELRNRGDWRETLEYVQIGLGPQVQDLLTVADPGGGAIGLWLQHERIGRLPLHALSDGMVAYLGFVALFRANATRSMVAFDEPELHLHPELLRRVLGMFETLAIDTPVVLATHSDRILDGLSSPVDSVVVCDLNDSGETQLRRLEERALASWLDEYRGVGDLRAEGHLRSVVARAG